MILRRSRRAKSASAQATARPCWARAAYITKPRGELHTMWNAGTTPARMIEVISPAGFENFFRDLTDLTTDGAHPSRPSRHSRRPSDSSSANARGYRTSSPATTSPRPAEREAASDVREDPVARSWLAVAEVPLGPGPTHYTAQPQPAPGTYRRPPSMMRRKHQ